MTDRPSTDVGVRASMQRGADSPEPRQQRLFTDGHGAGREFRIDPDGWDDVVAPAGRPQIVVGGPGTGKTQFLCRRIAEAIARGTPPEQILVLAFSRTGVADIRSRVSELIGPRAFRCKVVTYHALARRLVEVNASELGWSRPPTILTGVEQERFVADLLTGEDAAQWPKIFRSLLASPLMAAEMTDFILRSSEQGLDSAAIRAMGRPAWSAIPAFLDRYDAALRSAHRLDYGRLLMHATSIVQARPAIIGDHALVVSDEYQDTSPMQRKLLLALAADGADVTVTADPYQSIYSFRGSDIDNVFSFPSDTFEHLGTTADRVILSTSFRVPAAILDAAVAVTARELPGGAGRVQSLRSTGSVSCHEFATSGVEAEWIAADIERLHLVDAIPLDRIAVFVRSTSTFVDELARALDRRQIEHTHTDERLTDESIVRFLHDLVIASQLGEDSDAALRRVLLGPIFQLPSGLVATMPETAAEVARWVAGLPGCDGLAALVEERAWATDADAAQGVWHVWSSLEQLAHIATSPDRQRDRRAWSSYAQVVDRITERSPGTTLIDVVEITDHSDFDANALFAIDDAPGVTLGTLHRSKGTEFDVVYIADAVEGQLPDLRHRDSLLGVRFLNPHLPRSTSDYITFRLDEERRLAYTAMTRSTSRVVWTATVASDTGIGREPSRFMRLVAPSTPPTTDDRPLTPRSLLASLRRTIADPGAHDVERLAAVQFLADRRSQGFDPLDSYGIRERGPDLGLIEGDLRLSPSKAVRYDTCPRAFAIEHFVLTSVDQSVYMRFGTLVHTVVEATEREAMARGEGRGTAAEAIAHLEDAWDEHGLGSDTVGSAWKARAASMLTDLYERWPSVAEPVHLEIELSLEMDGTSWRGRADRIERSDGSLTIVDYKTGSAATVADAAASLQLGYYLLAAQRDPSVTRHGTVDAATFWHPKQLAHGKVVMRRFDPSNLDDVESELRGIAQSIQDEAFDPTPGSHCRTCPAITVCPAQPAGAEAFLP